MAEQGLTRHDLEAKIVKHSWEDEGFRAELVADPAGTFVKYLEVPAASLPKIVIHQEEPGSWHIVLPAKPPHSSELSEADLEKVTGGNVASAIWDPRWLDSALPPPVTADVYISTGPGISGGPYVSKGPTSGW
jgi:hypothetical protein